MKLHCVGKCKDGKPNGLFIVEGKMKIFWVYLDDIFWVPRPIFFVDDSDNLE